MTKVLVTGIMGFIPSYFAKYILNNTDWDIIGFGRNTDQRNMRRLDEIIDNPRLKLIFGDTSNNSDVSGICDEVDYVVNMAAKTFVDYSIRDPEPFIRSNINGTYNLLEESRRTYKVDGRLKKFIQCSTDEVYGSIVKGSYKEDARLNPTNPYSSAKAAGDMLALTYFNTYKLPIIITRTENNFGPWQHPQKAMPKFVKYFLEGKKLPIYGDGNHIRQWLHVKWHCDAIYNLLTNDSAKNGEIYHVAGNQELTNNELCRNILKILGVDEDKFDNYIEYIPDFMIRPGHDFRYSLNVEKLRSIGWNPKIELDEDLRETVLWYKENYKWLR